ncbi:MAG: 4-hydroxy-3-methylbut-2-enyl diphosphate reductase [Bacteroidales bacterium]|jgi:(E)-4-hydroxy-3-methyl-but-2-enyl pyrophosphate reductase|nr:4-hydroxy-3-methylbut-2-enyl diphosphate reductase [Bacteroidales bacterium]
MKIEIDKYAGFCFGVTKAIKAAEKNTSSDSKIYCLGKIVHNSMEEKRLQELGLEAVSYEDIPGIKGSKLIIRAHGEPPETYKLLKANDIEIIDETCPVVLNLQKKIRKIYLENKSFQIIIFGKKGHAEVNGLIGQTDGNAKVISSFSEAVNIDMSEPVFLFSQTTSNFDEYKKIENYLMNRSFEIFGNYDNIKVYHTICPSVIKRIPRLEEFCLRQDLVIFVSDFNSSNGKMLYEICKRSNDKSYFITQPDELNKDWFNGIENVGISGATSTPLWLMEKIKNEIEKLLTIKK